MRHKASDNDNKRASIVINVIFFFLYTIITTSLIFSQGLPTNYDESTKPNDTYADYYENDYSNNSFKFDGDDLSYIKDEKPILMALRNPEDYKLISEIDLFGVEIEKEKIRYENLKDLINLNIPNTVVEESDGYVKPSEIADNNFVFIAFHGKTDKKKDIKSYYEISINNKKVGATNQSDWNNSYKFFAYKLEKDKEYNILVNLKESSALGAQWLDASATYQPNYSKDKKKLVPITIVNNTSNKVLFLIVLWKPEEEVYYIETGYLNKTQHAKLWKAVNNFFNQNWYNERL